MIDLIKLFVILYDLFDETIIIFYEPFLKTRFWLNVWHHIW